MTGLERRIGLLFVGFALLLSLAVLRAIWFGAISATRLKRAAASQQVSTVPVPAPRGTITDRNGSQLAVSEPADSVAADPYLVHDPLVAAQRIAPILGRPVDQVAALLAKPRTGFVYLARGIPADRARPLSSLKMDGLQLIPENRRTYPQDWLASQLLGAAGSDGQGLSGLELSEDRLLRGRDGIRKVTKDAIGQPIAMRDIRAARPGRDVQLTLDANIQGRAEQVLAGIGATYRPKYASALVLDPRTGELLALANWPRVNANNLTGAPPADREDRAAIATYEPGSTFKAFTVAGALQDGRVTPQTSFDLAPSIQVADRTIHDAENRPAETLTTAQILAQSSNVGAITIGLREGRAPFDSWVHRFGFGRPAATDVPGEASGIVPRLDQYSGSSMGNLPIGQGLAVTPLQMAAGYAAMADDGVMRQPHVVRAVDGHAVAPVHGRRVISASTALALRTMLQGVLAPAGTASEVSIPGYQLAGKTGTANIAIHGGYSNTEYVASFVGFAPARSPRLLTLVMVDQPQGAIYGGTVAAPAFGDITAFALPYLRIPPG